MVPKGWSVQCVGNLFDVQLGKMLNQEAKEKFPQYKYLGNSNVKWGCFDFSDLKMMHFSQKDISKFSLEVDDILMCEGGEVGRCTIWEGSEETIFYQKALHRLRSNGKIIPKFFQFYMEKIAGTKLLDDYSTKTSIAHLTQEKLVTLPVRLPPLTEQKKIAKILSTWDKAISTAGELLANSQLQKKSLMQQLLTGKKRLLAEGGRRFKGEWKPLCLSKIAVVVMGSSPKSEAYNEIGNGLPLIQGNADIKNKLSEPRVYTSEITKECEPNDILLSVRAPVGAVALSRHKACIGRGITAIRANKNYNQSFIYQWLLWFEPQWVSLAQGSTFESVNSDDIKSLKVLIPEYEEQQKIADALSKHDQEISTLQQQLAAFKNEKTALMQQLLTGRRRVRVEKNISKG